MIENLLVGVRAIVSLLRGAAAILLVGSIAINFANIIGRYFFAVSIPWAEEIMLFLMVGCVFLGAGPVSWAGRHIRMDVLVSMMPPRIRVALELVSDLTFIAVSILLVFLAYPVVSQLAAFDQRSEAANFPLVIPEAMIPIGLSLMAILVAIRLFVQLRGGPPAGSGR